MSMHTFLRRSPVIAAIRRPDDLETAAASPVNTVFIVCGDINSVGPMVQRLKQAGKRTFVHVDLLGGLATDQAGLSYLARQIRPDGVISTRSQIVRVAIEEGLLGIQRFFLMDSAALETGIRQVKANKPHALEVMPGLLPRWVFDTLRERLDIPLVVGGLLKTREDVLEVLRRGAAGASVSSPRLWTETPHPSL